MELAVIAIRGYLLAALAVGAATIAGLALGQRASLADEAMLYALAILLAALSGRGPGLLAAVLSIAAFDFFFVEPRYTLDVADPQFLITFAVMFGVGVAIGSLTSRLRAAEAAARDREKRTETLLTERLRLAEAARDAELRASAEELRSALLSSVSHDFRTPLAVITGTASTLRESAPKSEHERLDTIVSEGARLGRIVGNLLAITRVESGAKPRREWIPVDDLVGPALARVEPQLADRRIEVAVGEDVLGHVDPILGELLLVNLLDNAAKHTPPGVAIELSARRELGTLVIEVADRGPGLPPGSEHRVFERFFTGKPGEAGAGAGVGLGLAVCRGIAIAHGGAIAAANRAGGGTTFEVRIPDGAPMPRLDDAPVPREVHR
jgi:two-component system, OmpR family, sensor histidine kinase KdpD